MSVPPYILDIDIWTQAKNNINKIYLKPSAYRSLAYFKEYKRLDGRMDKLKLNKTNKPLRRWVLEEWTNLDGQTGYNNKFDIYRPTIRISKETPITYKELTKDNLLDAMLEKLDKGRVKRFKKEYRFYLSKSKNPLKKYNIIITKDNNKIENIDFGGVRPDGEAYNDYIKYVQLLGLPEANKKKLLYIKRHSKNGFNNPLTANFWARYILWNKPTLKDSFFDAVKIARQLFNSL